MSEGAVEETPRLAQAAEWMIRLHEDKLPDEELARWIDWCDAHPENRAAFDRLMPLWQAFDGCNADEEGVAEVQSRSARHEMVRQRGKSPALHALAAASACVLLGTAVVLALKKVDPAAPVPALAQLKSAPGINRPATLPDGSTLELGARSSVAIDFVHEKRQIELGEGEAFFTVKPDRVRPFVVRAGEIQITAVGTQFNVLRTASRISVTVQEGSVRIARSVPGSRSLLAPAGYQVIYDDAGPAPARMRAIDPASSIAWRHGHLEYISEPMSSIIATLNRYSATPIEMNDTRLSQLQYTGTIEVTSIEEWVRALPRIFPVAVRADTGRGLSIEPRR